MFKQALQEKYSFLTKYFEQALAHNDRSIAHSILFYGQDIEAQYELATEISRLLNCQKSQDEFCSCLNCNWINEKKHPAVLTVSKLDNKPSDDTSKTVISIRQSQMIKNLLLNTSDYHRVFIFCDAKIEKIDGENKWIPLGLNETNFQAETANSLLKTIEEPPANTTFFFLTRDKNDVLDTIISRSQCFFVPAYNLQDRNYATVQEFFAEYPKIERKNVFDLAQELFNLSKEQGIENILNQFQNFLYSLLQTNINNKNLKIKILKDLKFVNETLKIVNNHINPQLALEDLFLNITEN